MAKGKYLAFIDPDDYVENNYLEKCINVFKNYDVDIVNTGFYSQVEGKDNIQQRFFTKEKYYKSRDEILNEFIYLWDNAMMYNIWNKIYILDIIRRHNIRFKNQKFGEDVEFNKEYFRYVNKMYNMEQCFYHYIREREGAATNKYVKNFFEIRVKEYYDFNDYFKGLGLKEEEFIEFSSRRYLERTLGCVESFFQEDCNLTFKQKYAEISDILRNDATKKSLKEIKPKSKKISIMLIPYRLNQVLLTMIMGKTISFIKVKFPNLFNKLKNER